MVLSTLGKFHTFDLARELYQRDTLDAVFSGYPAFKLRNEQVPPNLVRTFPWLHASFMAVRPQRFLGSRLTRLWEYVDRVTFDAYVSQRLPPCDVFVGLSSAALRSGSVAKSRGAKYVCDRGSSHIRFQDQLLRDEHRLWDFHYAGIDPRIIDREMAEYAAADCVTVPSTFSLQSFTAQGVSADKLRRIPYGVNLERFQPCARPADGRLDILFVGSMSLRKGVPYLLEAYAALRHPNKSLTFAGAPDEHFIAQMKKRGLWPVQANLLGHVSQPRLKEVMSRSHVFVLPSVEDGFGMVLAQAMACGCPVIATDHTGATDLYDDGSEGFIVPVRQAAAIAEKLTQMAEDSGLRERMSIASLARVRRLGGWNAYGQQAFETYRSLMEEGW